MSHKHYSHNPIKVLKSKFRDFDESGPSATSTLNFKGESEYKSSWPSFWFALGRIVIMLRLALFLNWMFTY